MIISCESVLLDIYRLLTAALSTIGVGGGSVYLIKFLKHMPAPKTTNRWFGAVFDSVQDTVSNSERIGERLAPDGTIIDLEPQAEQSSSTPPQAQPQATPAQEH